MSERGELHEHGARLLELQRIDSALDQLAYRRTNLIERKAADEAVGDLATTRQRIAAMIKRQRELSDAIEDAESQGADLTKHRERLQSQLRTIVSPREAEALMHELDTLAARRDALDDSELEHLEEQSQLVDDLAALHNAEIVQANTSETAAATLASVEAQLDAEVADLTVQRSEAVSLLDGGMLADYEQRRAHFGGVAVAHLDSKRCSGCHLDLSTVELGRVKATPPGGYTDCPQCGRILVP